MVFIKWLNPGHKKLKYMVKFFGRSFRKEDLLRRVGSIDQLGGIKLSELEDGPEKGVRIAQMRTGELNVLITVDRGLDIANAEYRGIPLAWISPTGITSPHFYEPESWGWLRGFFGGLVTTCGLTYMGVPTKDVFTDPRTSQVLEEELGLHGRISYAPARLTGVGGRWQEDDYVMWIEGELREVRVFEPNIVLRRRIEGKLGEKAIRIRDEVANEGAYEQPLMILYHINIGFPIVDEGSRLISTSRMYVPRDQEALKDAEKFDIFHKPMKGYAEKVYFHDMMADEDGYAYAAIINNNLLDGVGVYVRFRRDALHRFTEWKMMGEGTYVVGMEPGNALPVGRARERAWGTLQYIEPQETRVFQLEIGVIAGKEIEEFIDKVSRVTRGARPKMIKSVDEFVQACKH